MKKAHKIIAKYPAQYKKAAVIPLLELAQIQNKNFTSISVMNEVARILEMPPMRVYEVASFYTMFNRSGPIPRPASPRRRARHLLHAFTDEDGLTGE